MKTTLKTVHTLTLAVLTLLLAGQTLAQTTPTLRIATGKAGKGFSRVFADIKSVCGQKVSLSEVETEGGLQNLTVLAANKADLGFVQIDTIQSLQDSDPSIAALQSVMLMNSNLLHIVARTGGYRVPAVGLVDTLLGPMKNRTVVVARFDDLKGLPVAVVGSARALGREMDRVYQLKLQFVDVSTDEDGLARLKRGEVAALFSTSGWPSGPIQALKRSEGLHLVRFEHKPQDPYQVVARNYDNLDSFRHPFLSVPNALMTRPFTLDGNHGKAVAALRDCIRSNLTQLREGAYEPMWSEVRPDAVPMGLDIFGSRKTQKP